MGLARRALQPAARINAETNALPNYFLSAGDAPAHDERKKTWVAPLFKMPEVASKTRI